MESSGPIRLSSFCKRVVCYHDARMAHLAQFHKIWIRMNMADNSPAAVSGPSEGQPVKAVGTQQGVCSFETQHTVPIRGLSVLSDGKVIIGDKKGLITVAICLSGVTRSCWIFKRSRRSLLASMLRPRVSWDPIWASSFPVVTEAESRYGRTFK